MGNMTAVVLAGGRNSRFGGKDKAFVRIENVPMIELITGKLGKLFENIIIVTNTPEKYTGFDDFTVITDIYRNSGPLGGIHAAMTGASTPFIFVVSCDMPYIDTAIVSEMKDVFGKSGDADALIPATGSRIEPLHAIYRTALAESLGDFLASAEDYSIRAFLKDKRVIYYPLPDTARERKAFTNINRPSDLDDAFLSRNH